MKQKKKKTSRVEFISFLYQFVGVRVKTKFFFWKKSPSRIFPSNIYLPTIQQ